MNSNADTTTKVAGSVAQRTQEIGVRMALGAPRRRVFAMVLGDGARVAGLGIAIGGVASLAHPVRYSLSGGARRQLLADFVAAGGTALEVVSGGNGMQHVDAVAVMAVKYGLSGSVGSDFHDPELSWNPLGRSLKLPDGVTPVWRSYLET